MGDGKRIELTNVGYQDNWVSSANKRRLDWAICEGWLGTECSSSVLDIGCADGAFLQRLTRGERFGVEVNERTAKTARERGVRIIAGGIEELDLSRYSNKFDTVVCFDVIEHLRDPRLAITVIQEILKPNGKLVLSTGNFDAPSRRLMGAKYWYISIADHLAWISPSWCSINCPPMGLHLVKCESFPHGERDAFRLIYQMLRNLIFRMSCFTGKTSTPPGWGAAKDHFIALFRKEL